MYFYNLRRHVLHEVDAVGREDESDTNIVMFPNRFFSIHDIITNNLIKKTYLRKTCRGDSYYSLDKCFWQRKVEFNKSLVRIMSWSINLNDWLVYLLCLFCFHQYTKFYYNPNIPLCLHSSQFTFGCIPFTHKASIIALFRLECMILNWQFSLDGWVRSF